MDTLTDALGVFHVMRYITVRYLLTYVLNSTACASSFGGDTQPLAAALRSPLHINYLNSQCHFVDKLLIFCSSLINGIGKYYSANIFGRALGGRAKKSLCHIENVLIIAG